MKKLDMKKLIVFIFILVLILPVLYGENKNPGKNPEKKPTYYEKYKGGIRGFMERYVSQLYRGQAFSNRLEKWKIVPSSWNEPLWSDAVDFLNRIGGQQFSVKYCYNKFKKDLTTIVIDDDTNTLRSSGTTTPAFNGQLFQYVYGRRLHNPDATPNPNNKNAFLKNGDKELGYLYTVSWSVVHPYTSKEIEDMSRSERKKKGMDKDGNIYYRVVFHVANGQGEYTHKSELKGKVRTIPAGGSDSGTISFYNKIYFDKVYVEMSDVDAEGNDLKRVFKYDGSEKFPKSINCHNSPLGCFRDVKYTSVGVRGSYPDIGDSNSGGFPGSPGYNGGTAGGSYTGNDPSGDMGGAI